MDPSRNLGQEAGEESVRRLRLVGQGNGSKRGILWVFALDGLPAGQRKQGRKNEGELCEALVPCWIFLFNAFL